jgi:cell fate (sporulation/competence/biofilm development) regulator YlbF (YheA/YmcA/DUF963 family)
MPADTKEIMDAAENMGKLLAQHPAVEKYRLAQKSVAEDPEAGRLMAEFNRQLENLARVEQSGAVVTDAQRMQLESLQSRIVSNIKVKALNLAEVEFWDLLRKVGQTYQRQLMGEAPAAGGPRITMPRPG